jgi:plastocyanin
MRALACLLCGTTTILAACSSGGGGTTEPPPSQRPKNTVVATATNGFTPASLNVSVGTTVNWQFEGVQHTVNFDAIDGAPENIPATANATVPRPFGQAGVFTYHCTIHSGMNGTVAVGQGGTDPTDPDDPGYSRTPSHPVRPGG